MEHNLLTKKSRVKPATPKTTAAERISALNMHKCHILCWLTHALMRHDLCLDEDIMATILSTVPLQFHLQSVICGSTKECISRLLLWFSQRFKIVQDSFRTKGLSPDPRSDLLDSITSGAELTQEEAATVFFCLCRALRLAVRLVYALDVVSSKPSQSSIKTLDFSQIKKLRRFGSQEKPVVLDDSSDAAKKPKSRRTNRKGAKATIPASSSKAERKSAPRKSLSAPNVTKGDRSPSEKHLISVSKQHTEITPRKRKRSKEKRFVQQLDSAAVRVHACSDDENLLKRQIRLKQKLSAATKSTTTPIVNAQHVKCGESVTDSNPNHGQDASIKVKCEEPDDISNVFIDIDDGRETNSPPNRRRPPSAGQEDEDEGDSDFCAPIQSSHRKTKKGRKSRPKVEQEENNTSNTGIDLTASDLAVEESSKEETEDSMQLPPTTGSHAIFRTTDKTSLNGSPENTGLGQYGPPQVWIEVYCIREKRWFAVDPVRGWVDQPQLCESRRSRGKPLYYVCAVGQYETKEADDVEVVDCEMPLSASNGFTSPGTYLRDVTRRYVSKSAAIQSGRGVTVQKWWDESVRKLSCNTVPELWLQRNEQELQQLESQEVEHGLPSSGQAYKNHPLYCLESQLKKYEAIYPKTRTLGQFKDEAVYSRSCVVLLHTKERWEREARRVRDNELPYKLVKLSRLSSKHDGSQSATSGTAMTALYGEWQTYEYTPPAAANGLVPKNERGNVQLFGKQTLPAGTVHVRLSGAGMVAKRLGIDYAPAMMGFDIKGGRSVPIIDGVVVCAEHEEALRTAHKEMEQRRAEREKQKRIDSAKAKWRQVLKSLLVKKYMDEQYKDSNTLPQQTVTKQARGKRKQTKNSEKSKRGRSEDTEDAVVAEAAASVHHTHRFDVVRSQREAGVSIKKCSCGFQISCEEI
eukprot:GILK01013816.1.p1 GENE.GILK01013816.1~~GILK01013816.1.p1  ORF type:complete len:1008 (-),score=135.54 GILK01013816.1:18-2771(-)